MAQVVVFGQQVPVVPVVDADLSQHVGEALVKQWLEDAGYATGATLDAVAASLIEDGYDMPSADSSMTTT